jgi:TolB-like protein
MLESIWPGLIVEENNLNQCISLLRRVLGERPSEHRFIVTEPGRGYRFVATVRVIEAPGPIAPAQTPPADADRRLESRADRRSWRRLAASAAAIVLCLLTAVLLSFSYDRGLERLPRSVAVLPFEDLSPNPEHAYFAPGIYTELVGQLAKLRGLNVIAETSMRRYVDSALSIRDIADELRVETVLEGSIRYADDQVRVTVNLIDAATRASRWSDVYERHLADVFGIQAEIAASIAAALEAEFSIEEQQRLARPRTTSPEAYALYLQARQMLPDLGRRDQLLARAIEFDPYFADAYALRAQNYAHSIVNSYNQGARAAGIRRRATPSRGPMSAGVTLFGASRVPLHVELETTSQKSNAVGTRSWNACQTENDSSGFYL